jgi:hypothetical protein
MISGMGIWRSAVDRFWHNADLGSHLHEVCLPIQSRRTASKL